MNTKTDSGVSLKWDMKDVYDLLMFDIDKDLLFGNLANISEILGSLSEPERRKRVERYKKSMGEFQKKFEKFMSQWRASVRKYYLEKSNEVRNRLRPD